MGEQAVGWRVGTVSPSVAQLLGAAQNMLTCPTAPKLRLLLAASGL